MQPRCVRSLQHALSALAAITACGLLTANSAQAQGSMMTPGIGNDSPNATVDSSFFNYPSQGTHYDVLGNIIPYDTYTGPVFYHYPFVAPGALNVYTYTPYTGNPFAEGTLYGRVDKKSLYAPNALTATDDPNSPYYYNVPTAGTHYDAQGYVIPYDTYTGPYFYHYPVVSPGALEIYDYTPYTGNPFAEGTYYGKVDKKNLLAPHPLRRHPDAEEEEDDDYVAPAPLNYPSAAPGSLHLYHYRDYNQDDLVTGNLDKARMEKQERREMRSQRMKKNNM